MCEFNDASPGGGYFIVNNVVQTSPLVQLTAAQLAVTAFQAGAGTDNLYIRAFDGAGWSSDNGVRWTPFHVNGPTAETPTKPVASASVESSIQFLSQGLFPHDFLVL
jgi:hypothetical protein